jgi:hypothetical protein
MPLRPIVSSIFSITSGAEKYILKLLKLLVRKCSFLLHSTKDYTEKLKFIRKFTSFYEIVSFDATSLYTSINVPKYIKYIVEQIYNDPEEYFERNDLGSFPPKKYF